MQDLHLKHESHLPNKDKLFPWCTANPTSCQRRFPLPSVTWELQHRQHKVRLWFKVPAEWNSAPTDAPYLRRGGVGGDQRLVSCLGFRWDLAPAILQKEKKKLLPDPPTLCFLLCHVCPSVTYRLSAPAGSGDWSTECMSSYTSVSPPAPKPPPSPPPPPTPPTHSSLQRLWMDTVHALGDTWTLSVELFYFLECLIYCNFKQIKQQVPPFKPWNYKLNISKPVQGSALMGFLTCKWVRNLLA